MLLSVPKMCPTWWTQAGDRALCIQIGVMASPPPSPPPITFGTLCHLVKPESPSEKKIACISCFSWQVSRLWAGPGRWEGGLETMEPQTLNSQMQEQAGWVGAQSRDVNSILFPTAAWIPPLQIRNNAHLSKYHGMCVQVFFSTMHLLLRYLQHTCDYNFQPAWWSGLFGWQIRLCSLWMPLYTECAQLPRPVQLTWGNKHICW